MSCSDFEPRIAEPLPNGKIVKKKNPQRLSKGVLLLNNFSIDLQFAVYNLMCGMRNMLENFILNAKGGTLPKSKKLYLSDCTEIL